MRGYLACLALSSCVTLMSPASASVTYSFLGSPSILLLETDGSSDIDPFATSFTYTSSDFITSFTEVSAEKANCYSGLFTTCTSVSFDPTSSADVITVKYTSAFGESFARFSLFDGQASQSDTYNFKSGSFGQAGVYPSVSEDLEFSDATLTVAVNTVPLPSSAPLFGAALIALGAAGYGLKRRKAAAAR